MTNFIVFCFIIIAASCAFDYLRDRSDDEFGDPLERRGRRNYYMEYNSGLDSNEREMIAARTFDSINKEYQKHEGDTYRSTHSDTESTVPSNIGFSLRLADCCAICCTEFSSDHKLRIMPMC